MSDQLTAVIEGLSRPHKTISPKYFYDEIGSKLFEDITRLPEYYLTNTELHIMDAYIDEMTDLIGAQASLIEFGAGSGQKTRLLLEHMHDPAAYVPVDISGDHLLNSQQSIQEDFPDVEVIPVAADFTQPFDLPHPATMPVRNLVYFPGSTIGNFEHHDAIDLMRVMHTEAGENGALLIGADLQKDPAVIDAAYNDSAGVTAEFNLNMLRHLNREFGSDFEPDAFEHRAAYKPEEGRVVIELVSTQEQQVNIGETQIEFARGEPVLTEYSHKYTLEQFDAMVEEAGFRTVRVWTDPRDWFSVHYCTRL